jgi:hypothetical protein
VPGVAWLAISERQGGPPAKVHHIRVQWNSRILTGDLRRPGGPGPAQVRLPLNRVSRVPQPARLAAGVARAVALRAGQLVSGITFADGSCSAAAGAALASAPRQTFLRHDDLLDLLSFLPQCREDLGTVQVTQLFRSGLTRVLRLRVGQSARRGRA